MNNLQKVSVCIITYNQDQYINECIESALMQIIDSFEIVIGDDCSTDNTSAICQYYQNMYPDRIKYHRRQENIGIMRNWLQTINECMGEYIAICEGDDYWTDPYKLQRQVEFLEANTEYYLIGGKAQVLKENKFTNIIGGSQNKNRYKLSDLVSYNDFITCTVMFKNLKFDYTKLSKLTFVDWGIYCLILKDGGKAYLMDDVLAVYRNHNEGITKKMGDKKINWEMLNQYSFYRKHFKLQFDELGIKQINDALNKELSREIDEKNRSKAFLLLYKSIYLKGEFSTVKKYFKSFTKMFFKL
jgi:glycosyltransferase involved in cell wall biosynthesis